MGSAGSKGGKKKDEGGVRSTHRICVCVLPATVLCACVSVDRALSFLFWRCADFAPSESRAEQSRAEQSTAQHQTREEGERQHTHGEGWCRTRVACIFPVCGSPRSPLLPIAPSLPPLIPSVRLDPVPSPRTHLSTDVTPAEMAAPAAAQLVTPGAAGSATETPASGAPSAAANAHTAAASSTDATALPSGSSSSGGASTFPHASSSAAAKQAAAVSAFTSATRRRVLQGTCGWNDASILKCGRFYPSSVKTAVERLPHYATHFPSVEWNLNCCCVRFGLALQ